MARARSLAPLLGERGRAPFKPEANRFLDGGDVATVHPQQLLRIGARPDLVIRLQRRSLRVLCGGGQEACHYPWTCDTPVTRERIRKGLRQDTPGDGELARGTEQLAYRSGSCPDERSGGRGIIGAPISKMRPISRLSAQLLAGRCSARGVV